MDNTRQLVLIISGGHTEYVNCSPDKEAMWDDFLTKAVSSNDVEICKFNTGSKLKLLNRAIIGWFFRDRQKTPSELYQESVARTEALQKKQTEMCEKVISVTGEGDEWKE